VPIGAPAAVRGGALDVVVLGQKIRIECASPELLRGARRAFAAFGPPRGRDRRRPPDLVLEVSDRPPTVRADGRLLARAGSVPEALALLEHHVVRLAVARTRVPLLVHGAAAAWYGRGLLLCGPKAAGKTTLVARLVQLGLRYLADDCVPVDDDARLGPLPRPLGLKPGSLEVLAPFGRALPRRSYGHEPGGRDRVLVLPARTRIATSPVPGRVIIFPQHRQGAPSRLEGMRRAEALLRLVTETFRHRGSRGPAFRTAARLVRACSVYRLTFGDARAAAPLLARLLREAPRSQPHVPGAARPDDTTRRRRVARRVYNRRAPRPTA
jgi:hypothetical protein